LIRGINQKMMRKRFRERRSATDVETRQTRQERWPRVPKKGWQEDSVPGGGKGPTVITTEWGFTIPSLADPGKKKKKKAYLDSEKVHAPRAKGGRRKLFLDSSREGDPKQSTVIPKRGDMFIYDCEKAGRGFTRSL